MKPLRVSMPPLTRLKLLFCGKVGPLFPCCFSIDSWISIDSISSHLPLEWKLLLVLNHCGRKPAPAGCFQRLFTWLIIRYLCIWISCVCFSTLTIVGNVRNVPEMHLISSNGHWSWMQQVAAWSKQPRFFSYNQGLELKLVLFNCWNELALMNCNFFVWCSCVKFKWKTSLKCRFKSRYKGQCCSNCLVF